MIIEVRIIICKDAIISICIVSLFVFSVCIWVIVVLWVVEVRLGFIFTWNNWTILKGFIILIRVIFILLLFTLVFAVCLIFCLVFFIFCLISSLIFSSGVIILGFRFTLVLRWWIRRLYLCLISSEIIAFLKWNSVVINCQEKNGQN